MVNKLNQLQTTEQLQDQLVMVDIINQSNIGNTLTFDQVLNTVLSNLRVEGQFQLADKIEHLAKYIIELERIKALGTYKGTDTERILDKMIMDKKNELIAIVAQLIK